ncbi:hypothetical protein P4O66_018852 [Electrophorus voltai]|uniref:F-box domain-containing protein n=1 Tax=Electrophorus voltai TaxID=2609070 RepID=A0AAD8YRI2_9TELE|nr:hypothetical protein P4O66_018852 [Electrophorus voltai]
MDINSEELPNRHIHEMPVESGSSSRHGAPGSEEVKSKSEKAGTYLKTTTVPAKRKPLKRKANSLSDATKKKKKKVNVKRAPRANYTVQHGEDMLLIISNTNQFDRVWKPKRKGCKKRKVKTKSTSVKLNKHPTKPKVSKVTGETVSDVNLQEPESFDWGQRLPIELLVKIFELIVLQDGAVPFLCRVGRVCRLWNSAASSPALWRSVSIGYCWTEPGKSQLPGTEQKIRNTVNWLAQNRFSDLRYFTLCHWKKHVDYVVQFQDDGLVSFLEMCGNRLKRFLFTRSSKSDKLLNVLCRGCCPELRLLEINTKLDSGHCTLPICIQALQLGCPKLQTFRLMNVNPIPKMIRNTPSATPGFPMLEELCIASSSHLFMTDLDLLNVLHGSPHLRVLDLRGCSRITAVGLYALPCQAVSTVIVRVYTVVPEKLEHQSNAWLLVAQSTTLNYLNLSSCRYLPRGLKRIYRGQKDIHQLLEKLS